MTAFFETLDWRQTSFVSTEPAAGHTSAWFGPGVAYYCNASYRDFVREYVLKLPTERAAEEAGWEFALDAEAALAQTRRALERYGAAVEENTAP